MSHADDLSRFVSRHPHLAVLTGAGCSAASGIPPYRDDDGNWIHPPPVQYGDFVASDDVRRRYWARSFVGWQNVWRARPNAAHLALAELEARGYVRQLITQNVDDLHRDAGSREVVDLHGRLRIVRCLDCNATQPRDDLQAHLERINPGWAAGRAGVAPDGDATVDDERVRTFAVPDCENCGGLLKPDVVFFGESVPRDRVERCSNAVAAADALLVVGSSLMVYSGFRFAREAEAAGKPVAIVNLGRTRADELATVKVSADCGRVLEDLLGQLPGGPA